MHNQATCDYSKCEPFYKRLAIYLDSLEDARENKAADMVIEALANCVPNPSGSCKTADRVSAVMRKLKAFGEKSTAR